MSSLFPQRDPWKVYIPRLIVRYLDSKVRSVIGWCERRVIAVPIPISQTHSRRAVVVCSHCSKYSRCRAADPRAAMQTHGYRSVLLTSELTVEAR